MPGAYSGDDAWKAACDEADRLDPGWRWDELQAKRPFLPADQDAIQVTMAAADQLPMGFFSHGVFNTDADIPGLNVAEKRVATWATAASNARAANSQADRDFNGDPHLSQLSQDLLGSLKVAINSASQAKALGLRLVGLQPGRAAALNRPLMLNVPGENLTRQPVVSNTLRLCAILAANESRFDHAILCARAILGVGRVMTQPAMLLTGLGSFGSRKTFATAMMRTLALGVPSERALAEAQQDAEAALKMPVMLEAMRGERALVEDTYIANEQGGDIEAALANGMREAGVPRTIFDRIDCWIKRLFPGQSAKARAAREFEFYTAVVERLKTSPDAMRREPAAIKAMRKRAGRIVSYTMRHITILLHVDRQQRAILTSIVIALACERFRIANQRWPESLDDLVPDFLDKVPVSPFDLQPMRYAVSPSDILVSTTDHRLTFMGGMAPKVSGFRRGGVTVRLRNPERRVSS